ncbi:MAG: phosphoglycerate kinase [Nanoarchaeota archaeon]|nr:phosphoglycerate kinase [Nanoarchaeota archaeon]
MKRFLLTELPIKNKTIFLRVDFNVPFYENKITDNTKIKASLPTIKYLLQNDCKIVLATHFGRPKGFSKEFSVAPLAKELQRLLPSKKVLRLDDCIGKKVIETIKNGKPQTIFMLENLRFYPEEEKNDSFFAHSLASQADVYVNDAFGVAHRKHASVCAITEFLPSAPGLLLETEIRSLSQALNPERPSVWIMGGAKLDKIALLEKALQKYDQVLIGGALAFAFLKAKGIPVGASKTDAASTEVARNILKSKYSHKIVLPVDFAVAEFFSPRAKVSIVDYNHIESHQVGLDLGPKTVNLFRKYLSSAKTVVWNGPLGYIEWTKFAVSTKEIGRFLGKLEHAVTIAGGGETAEALIKYHLHHNLTHVSTGGGAALEFLAGKELPALECLEKNYKKFRKRIIP